MVSKKISEQFKDEVLKILKRDFSLLFYGMDFTFKFVDGTMEKKYEKLHGWIK